MTCLDPQIDHHLSAAEQRELARDGFVIRRDVFTDSEVADMVEHCEALIDHLVAGRQGNRVHASGYVFEPDAEHLTVIKWEGDTDVVHGIEPFAHLSPPMEAWAYDPRLTQPMETFVGHAEPELFTEKLNLKRPRLGGANPMHQDYPYWVNVSDDASQIATTIIFLDDSSVDNGCLWVIPGSHKQGKWTTRTDGDEFAHNEVDPAAYPDATAVPVELPKGSTLSFGAFLVHKSAQNLSDENRRTLLYSYQPPGRRRQVDSVRNWVKRTPR